MSERKQLSSSDWIGIGLFAFGSTGAVLMLLSMSTNGPIEAQGPFGPIAAGWKNTLGLFPSLFMNAAIALLGARLFLEVGKPTLVRNLLGCSGLAIALAVICGGWKIDAGGYVGQRTGAVVAEYTHVAVGTLLGLVSFFAVAWFAWFRSSVIAEQQEMETSVPVAAVLEKSALKSAGRPAVHKTTAANEGVSLAESAALFPEEDDPVVVKKLSPDEIARASLAPFSTQELPPSPYPEDVRKKGQIPPGARPLENPNATTRAESSVSSPTVYRWTAPRDERADDRVGTDLVEPADTQERVVEERIIQKFVAQKNVDAETGNAAIAEERPLEREETPELNTLDARLPVTPVWEQAPAAFKPEEGDEEPVDAYGTPLTLVETLRRARRAGGIEPLPVVEGGAGEPDVIVPRELDADIVAVKPASFEALEAQTIDETDVTLFEEAELEETTLVAEIDQDDLLDDAEIVEPSDRDEIDSDEREELDSALVDEEIVEPVAVGKKAQALKSRGKRNAKKQAVEAVEEVSVDEISALDERVEPALEAEHASNSPSARSAKVADVQPSLFDAVGETKPARIEREVVLQPVVAAVSQARTTKDHPVELDARTKLLSEIGCLFVERGRVAVSMLQRQYEMDFDDACKVLDDLQEMGLIGPYLGGQRRDILLSREQWLERVSQVATTR